MFGNLFKNRIYKDSLMHSRKRKITSKSILITTAAIVASTIIAALVACIFGYDPFIIIKSLFSAGFINEPSTVVYYACSFALAGLAFSFAFKAGVFNIGISGQMFGAGVVLVVVTNALKNVDFPPFVGQVFALLITMISASAISTLTGVLERYLKVNPIVSGIILNWIIYLVGFFILNSFYAKTVSGVMVSSIDIPEQFLLQDPNIGGWLPAIIITVIIAIILYVLIKFTVFGHKINSTGLSLEGSRCAGYNVALIKLATFAISGAIAGALALVLYTSKSPNMNVSELNINVPIEGFNGIMIGLISNNNPIGILVVSLVLGLYRVSSSYLLPPATFNDVIVGFVMLGAALSVLAYQFKPWYFFMQKKYTPDVQTPYNVYENSMDSLLSKYKSIYSTNKTELKKVLNKQKFRWTYYNFNEYCRVNKIKGFKKVELLFKHNHTLKQQYRLNNHSFGNNLVKNYDCEYLAIRNNYYLNVVEDLMQLKFNPKKYIVQSSEKINNSYDNTLTKYVSKQKAMMEKDQQFITKANTSIFFVKSKLKKLLKEELSRKERLALAYIISHKKITLSKINDLTGRDLLKPLEKLITYGFVNYQLEDNEYVYVLNKNALNMHHWEETNIWWQHLFIFDSKNRLQKITKAIDQNTVWKEIAIRNMKKKIASGYHINEIIEKSDNFGYITDCSRLNRANLKILRIIHNKIDCEKTNEKLLKNLIRYNENILNAGGKIC